MSEQEQKLSPHVILIAVLGLLCVIYFVWSVLSMSDDPSYRQSPAPQRGEK